MNKLTEKFIAFVLCFSVVLSVMALPPIFASAENDAPLTLELKDVQGTGADYLEIEFDKIGVKKLLGNYAKLEKGE